MRSRQCGDRALLVEFDDADQVVGFHRSLRADPPAGLVESVPAARTVLVVFDAAVTSASRLAGELATRRPDGSPAAAPSGDLIEVPVVYDGPDLHEVASRTGLPVDALVARHSGSLYTVAFCGYAPGFAYLTGLDPTLRLPRRSSPRTRVPAGAVAIADEFSAIYPRAGPGGWHLLGQTDIPLWTLDRATPALLRPGDRVRFVPPTT
jgi:KipI family sensor histidine kinase inhibitor